MFTASFVALVLAASALAGPMKRDGGLTVALSGPPDAMSVHDLKFSATVKNDGTGAVKILKYGTILDDSLPTRSFKVTKDGGEVAFTGIKPFIDLEAAGESAYTVIQPGGTITVSHDVSALFDFATAGAGKFKFEPLVDFHSALEGAVPQVSSNAVEVSLGQVKKRELIDKRAKDICTDTHSTFVDSAYSEAKQLATAAVSYISTNGANSLYTSYFKTTSTSEVSGVFTAVANEDSSTRTLGCTDPAGVCKEHVIAYTTTDTNIYFCDIFFQEVPQSSLCTGATTVAARSVRGATVLHELTHAVANTDDVVYGCANDQALSASQSRVNADSYNTRQFCGHSSEYAIINASITLIPAAFNTLYSTKNTPYFALGMADLSDVSIAIPKPNNLASGLLDARRRAALAEVDNAKFSWFHVKVCMVAGAGFFTDAYDIFAINIAAVMLGYVYGARTDPSIIGSEALNANQDLGVKVATPIGTLIGQVLFGWLADLVGHGVELMVIIVTTFAQALSGSGHAVNIIGVLIVWRFLMGIGIGGDYPLSAVISSEFASTKIRGRMMNAVFAFQGWGNFAACIIALIIVSAYKNSILMDDSNGPHRWESIDDCWRILIGLGCVPGVVALYFRLTIPETPRFTMDIERNIHQAAKDIESMLIAGKSFDDAEAMVQRPEPPRASWKDFSNHFSKLENFKVLFGCAYSWFALDIAFYGLGLNSSNILNIINFGSAPQGSALGVYESLKNICIGNLILSVAGLIPGYWVCFLFIDSWGRKPIQLMGFIVLTVLFIIMGFGFDALNANNSGKHAFVAFYCLASFFQNFGPNTTTFIVPGEAFPTRYRSTGHGISAGSGKLGAIIAQVGFYRLKDIGGPDKFLKHILEIFALFMLTGVFSTLLIPETKGRSLEELSNEDQEGFYTGPALTSMRREI
ncbi:hypothetical protein V5O48_005218 [Marasmius crinis-equi]|uniref:Neutral protease 2 n=1 Tax=Marasmius crinis-equi TaxID=585013 RepID=A0ABR3FN31_9AGAR